MESVRNGKLRGELGIVGIIDERKLRNRMGGNRMDNSMWVCRRIMKSIRKRDGFLRNRGMNVNSH